MSTQDDLLTFAKWAIDQLQGDSGTGYSHWQQFSEFRMGVIAVKCAADPEPSIPWKMEVPVLCTSHLPQNVFDQLEYFGGMAYIADLGEYGKMICIPDEDCEWTSESPELEAIVKHARERDWSYIRFDNVGDAVDGLPQFDW